MSRQHVAAILLAGLLAAGQAAGHAMPNSTVVLTPAPGCLRLVATIPLSELQAALGGPVRLGRSAAPMEAYARAHIAVSAADGRPFAVRETRVDDIRGEHPALRVSMIFTPPPQAAAGPPILRYDAVIDRIASHYVLVYMKVGSHAPSPLARLQAPTFSSEIRR